MDMRISFPGGLAVDAAFKGFTVATDQRIDHGGRGKAPEPFDLFLASLGTCAGLFVLRFCHQRNLSTEGLGLTLNTERDPATPRLSAIKMEIHLPPGFPEKYRDAVVRAAEQCTVKRHILEPPRFETVATLAAEPVLADVS